MIRKEIEHLAISIDELQTHPSNVRQGDVGAISESMKAHGQYRPIVYQQSTKRILAGNHTYKAAKALGWTHIAATPVVCDDQQALRILLADNKANDLATYDEPELIELLKQLVDTTDGLLGTLFDEDELDSLIEDNSHFELPSDVDDVPDNVAAISKLGDVWLLGEHRVMCGDSTKTNDMNKLMLGKTANMVLTDPPYGVSYQSNKRTKTEKFDVLKNDDVILDIVPTIKQFSEGWVFVWTSWKVINKWIDALSQLEYPTNMIIWNKGGGGIGDLKKTYFSDYEIALVWNRGNELTGKRYGSVWDIGKDAASKYVHPTQKPVALGVQAIETTTNRNDIVLDLFGGSGSTLIAAQETNRTAYLMELDPHYVDVICARYQKHTGNQPVLEATGEPHNFLTDAD
jgi:site-specific DNA-methyltransferase (adenine-specific)